MNHKDVSEVEKKLNIKLPTSYVEALISCPTEFDEEYGPILCNTVDELIDLNNCLNLKECLKGKYFAILDDYDDWRLIYLSVDDSEIIHFDSTTDEFDEDFNHENINSFIEFHYNDRKGCAELDSLQELTESEVKEKFYDINTVAIYVNFLEQLEQTFEDLDVDLSVKVVLASLKSIGITIKDPIKLSESADYFMQFSSEAVYSQPGYEIIYDKFDEHF
jgi:hypothetical protein